MKDCPVCDGSGNFPEGMTGSPDVPCWVCHGKGVIQADREVSPVWLAYGKSKRALS
ncbi:hypothetical protein LX81_04225 [Palleronia aestuarii]|uniref:Molecular chaperone DnaJ n=1 Tax=Palleronia aestuarii TaxID=568105 RepID=A0A2W7MR64_9RHOB|nr:hypothetical protein LX81_04225 [Palleronia aestuarii]